MALLPRATLHLYTATVSIVRCTVHIRWLPPPPAGRLP